MAKRQRVAIVGIGYSTIGRHTGLSLDTLTAQSAVAAMQDAGVKPTDIDGVTSVINNMTIAVPVAAN